MRAFFLWLLLSWIAGIALAQWSQWRLIAVMLPLLIYIAWHLSLNLPLIVSGVLVFSLGTVYGQPVPISSEACNETVPQELRVVSARLQADKATYVMADVAGCRLQITAARFPAYATDDTLLLTKGKRTPVADIVNTGYAAYLQRQSIVAAISFPVFTRTGSTAARPPSLNTNLDTVIKKVFIEPDAGIAAALLLARTDGLPATLQENFRATGLSHLLAISGMNITMLAGILIALLHIVPLSPLTRTILVSTLLWGYMALLGWPISAVRATFFWTIALLALRLHLLTSLPTVLGLTLLGMVSLKPELVTDVGFQLSVSAVTGIFLILFLTKRQFVSASTFTKVVAGSLLVTLGATLTTWPIIAYHFGTVSLLSVPANLLVAPVVFTQMTTAILAVGLGFVWPAAAMLPAYLFHLTVIWMDVISTALAQVSWAYLQDISLPGSVVVLYYLGIAALCYWWLRRQRRSWREIWG